MALQALAEAIVPGQHDGEFDPAAIHRRDGEVGIVREHMGVDVDDAWHGFSS